ncbi:MAG: methyltransferase [Candidatus Cloacimonadaceae bacterium]|jgi:methylase of polypeptide subunit release factors|nr:methyltransferase [Candidatus Cloacimonadota bacterium]MCK9243270.1 methyltransferase [Candidatus Cloacimonadota bacterium]MDY0128232.1 methyltransferase [Candidatus Cloacimonadaceae bacterium]
MNCYHLYAKCIAPLRNNTLLLKLLFGFCPSDALWGQYWDWTTLSLRGSLKRTLKPETKLLDMGCGAYAVLSRYAQIKLSCRAVTAVDHFMELIEYAKQHDPESGIEYLCSDLFSNVQGVYSLIVFNAPYLETEKGKRLGLFQDDFAQKRFCGGKDGADTITRFLHDLPEYLSQGGRVLLGVNHYHISKEVVRAAIHKAGLKNLSFHYNPLTNACVYELKKEQYA